MTDHDWAELTAELAELLQQLSEDDTVILNYGDSYVQFRQGPAVLTLEAASNEALSPEHQLTADDEDHLTRLGWQRPDPPGRHNWWLDQPWPLHSREATALATALITTLRDVFQVPHATDLTRESFTG